MKTIPLKDVNTLDPISEIVTMLAHQINSPLSCIIASAELSTCHADDETAIKKHCANILKCADMIRDLNRKILKIGKCCHFRTEMVDLTTLLDNCLDTFKDMCEADHVTVKRTYDFHPIPIRCNRFGLEQVFNNLILNALDAMNTATDRRLFITTTCNPVAGTASVWIRDTGAGISDSVLSRIFLPDFTTKKNGNGLGLAICKYIVEKHQGNIEAVSSKGNGASFGVHLPMKVISS